MLKQLQQNPAKAIPTFEDQQKAETRAMLEPYARELDYSLAELTGVEGKAPRIPALFEETVQALSKMRG